MCGISRKLDIISIFLEKVGVKGFMTKRKKNYENNLRLKYTLSFGI